MNGREAKLEKLFFDYAVDLVSRREFTKTLAFGFEAKTFAKKRHFR